MLTQALEKPEHPGRVRAVGRYVTPTAYFNNPRQKRQGINKDLLQELVDAKKMIKEQALCMGELKANVCGYDARIEKLEAMLLAVNSMDKDEKGSCSVKFQQSKVDGYDDDDDIVQLVDEINSLQVFKYYSIFCILT